MPLDPANEVLKVISVKQLPQTLQVPNMYRKEFHDRMLVDTNMVILACRKDIETLYAIAEAQQLELDSHEARIAALEALPP